MTYQPSGRGHALFAALSLVWYVFLLSPAVAAEAKLEVKPVTEKKVSQLPAGPLYWHIENLMNLDQLPACNFKLSVFPIKWEGTTGAPVRAVGIVEE